MTFLKSSNGKYGCSLLFKTHLIQRHYQMPLVTQKNILSLDNLKVHSQQKNLSFSLVLEMEVSTFSNSLPIYEVELNCQIISSFLYKNPFMKSVGILCGLTPLKENLENKLGYDPQKIFCFIIHPRILFLMTLSDLKYVFVHLFQNSIVKIFFVDS